MTIMVSAFKGHGSDLDDPAEDAFNVGDDPGTGTPGERQHDTEDLRTEAKALSCGTGGNIKVRTVKDTDVTFTSLQAGQVLPQRVKRIFKTGTTATGIVAHV